MAKSKHDKVASQTAKREGAQYNQGQGADIQGQRRIIEVETPNTIGDASRQLQGYKKPVYCQVTDNKAVKEACEHYKKTTIGVMDSQGKIAKPSTRGKRS